MCRPSIFCQTQKWKERFQIIQLTCRSAPVESPATSVWTGAYACACTSLAPTFKNEAFVIQTFLFSETEALHPAPDVWGLQGKLFVQFEL